MSRRRRGRRRTWEPRDGAMQPGQARWSPDPRSHAVEPPRGLGPQAGASTVPARRQSPHPGSGPGAREERPRFGRGRFTGDPGNTQAGAGRPWWPREDGAPHLQYAQAQRWAQRPARPPRGPRPQGDPDRRRGVTPPPSAPPVAGGRLDPFELFCAYHLGIAADGSYRIQNIHEVARRFGTNAAALKQTLSAYGMDADDIVHSGFDLAGAQLDIMVAPEGISRRELARPLFAEFTSAPRRTRNWAKEMEDAEREIERTIGREGAWSPTPRDRAGRQS